MGMGMHCIWVLSFQFAMFFFFFQDPVRFNQIGRVTNFYQKPPSQTGLYQFIACLVFRVTWTGQLVSSPIYRSESGSITLLYTSKQSYYQILVEAYAPNTVTIHPEVVTGAQRQQTSSKPIMTILTKNEQNSPYFSSFPVLAKPILHHQPTNAS